MREWQCGECGQWVPGSYMYHMHHVPVPLPPSLDMSVPVESIEIKQTRYERKVSDRTREA
jgi:hypothetical protein